MQITVLHPPAGGVAGAGLGDNPNAVVLRVAYGDVSVLLCADVEDDGLRRLLRWGPGLRSTVLKMPHHGSRLEELGPQLLARVRLALLKANGELSADTIKRGDLLIDVANYRVLLNQQPVDLTYKEYELLKFLATNDGKVFTREALLNRVWGYNYYGGARTVDVHIRRIRSKIEAGGAAYIETVRNVGYRFSAR